MKRITADGSDDGFADKVHVYPGWNTIGALSFPMNIKDMDFDTYGGLKPTKAKVLKYGIWGYKTNEGYYEVYKAKIILLEKECDVCFGISGRNSGVSHAGFYMPPKSLKARLNVLGNKMLPELCEKLGVPFKEVGKLVIAKNEDEISYIEKLKKQKKKQKKIYPWRFFQLIF